MSVNIRLMVLINKRIAGAWLKGYAPEAQDGRGHVESTADRDKAIVFADYREAFEFYQTVPKNHPIRESDGKPNRPLTAYTIEIIPTDQEPLL